MLVVMFLRAISFNNIFAYSNQYKRLTRALNEFSITPKPQIMKNLSETKRSKLLVAVTSWADLWSRGLFGAVFIPESIRSRR